MPLIDLKSRLSDLKYGKDRPGGGNSVPLQPFVRKSPPSGRSVKSPDFLVRNGFLFPFSLIDDFIRVGTYFTSVDGLLFIAKQNALALTSPTKSKTVLEFLKRDAYSPITSLAQVALSGLGVHFTGKGFNPVGNIDYIPPIKERTSRVGYSRSPGLIDPPGISFKGVPDEVKQKKDPFKTKGIDSEPLDKVNALSIYKSSDVDNTKPINDFIKFRIAAIDNVNPTQKEYIHFRAFLNGFTDNYSAQWNGFRYPNRGEQFYKYGGFDRTFSLTWTVYAQSKAELIPMYQKLNFLASLLAPDYGTNGFMKGNLIELTVGGYLFNQPGFITSLTYTAPEDTPYEIGVVNSPPLSIGGEGEQDLSVKELPYRINVSTFNFTPIHNFVPEKQKNLYNGLGNSISEFGNQRYIALQSENNNYSSDAGVRPNGGKIDSKVLINKPVNSNG